jgi:lipopolysaccharide export system protein LptA
MNLERSTSKPQPSLSNGTSANRIWTLSVLFCLVCFASYSQNASPTVIKGFNVSKYFPAPHFAQMEMRLTGETGTELPGKQFQVTQPRLVTFEKNGRRAFEIESPSCNYNDPARTLDSTARLLARTGEGQFSITGEGFSFQQKTGLLIISNDVQATIINPTNKSSSLVITSRWFEFDVATRRGVFHESVRGEDADYLFNCGMLTIKGSTNNAPKTAALNAVANPGSFDWIEAEGGLQIVGKSKTGCASGQRGTFYRADERLELIGDATWAFDGKSGKADRITARNSDESYEAVGNVVMRMPRESLGAAGGLLSTNNPGTKSSGNNMVEIQTDHLTKRANHLLADGAVRLNDGTNRLSCDRLEALIATKPNRQESSTATGNVFVERGGAGIRSERADYSKSDGKIVFTGEPRFIQDKIQGSADRLTVITTTSEVLAENNVSVSFPLAAGGGSLLGFFPGQETNRVSQQAQITAKDFRLKERIGKFTGNVQAHQLPRSGGEPRLSSDELEVRIAPDRRHAESLEARQNVIYEQGMPGVTNGANAHVKMTAQNLVATADAQTQEMSRLVADGGVRIAQEDSIATGERAIYTRGDQLLKLSGNPRIKTPDATFDSERELVWDNARKTAVGSDYKIAVNPETLKRVEESQKLQTNALPANP